MKTKKVKKYRVLISAPYMQTEINKLRPVFKERNISIDLPKVHERLSEKELIDIIGLYDGIICGDDEITQRVLEKAEKLKVIVKWGTGVDSIDKQYAEKIGIRVCNTANAFSEPVADSVLGYILSFARNIPVLDSEMKKGTWKKVQGASLREKTLGIIGLGNVGRAVAQRAQAFGMDVLVYDVLPISKEVIKKYNIIPTHIEKLLTQSDYISLHSDLNETSRYIISKKEFLQMKNDAVLINTARGPLVKENDLIDALKKKKIRGAALDVFEYEPLPKKSPLRSMKNILLSPHNTNSSPHYWNLVHENSITHLLKGLGI